MFAVDHAATALLIKRRFPSVSLVPMLLSVQAMELAWVGLNYLGLERTTTEASVRSVADIHLAYMPFSHSVATAAGGALLAWLVVEKGLRRPLVARAIGIGIFSHLLLDVMTHARDIAFWPGSTLPALGLGLYDRAPMWGFVVEMAYGAICWRVYRGSMSLLAAIVLGNLANLTLFSAAIPGPEQYLAGHPLMVVTVVFVQIVATLVLIDVLATRTVPDFSTVGSLAGRGDIAMACDTALRISHSVSRWLVAFLKARSPSQTRPNAEGATPRGFHPVGVPTPGARVGLPSFFGISRFFDRRIRHSDDLRTIEMIYLIGGEDSSESPERRYRQRMAELLGV